MKNQTLLVLFIILFLVFISSCGSASSDSTSEEPAETTPAAEEPALPSSDPGETKNEQSPEEQPPNAAAEPQEHSSSGGLDIVEEKKADSEEHEEVENSRRSITARVSDELLQAAEGSTWRVSISFSTEGGNSENTITEKTDAAESTSGGGTAEGEVRFRRSTKLPDSGGTDNSDDPQNTGEAQGEVQGEVQKQAIYSLSLAPLQQTLHFPYGAVGFIPREISIEISSSVRVEKITFEPDVYGHGGPAEEMEPLSADLGVILSYPKNQWRREEYELFRWNLIPEVLVFDFADYAVQRRYFTRLAFFVGVTGESGSIEEHSYYEGRHVFNAHDYRPEDLAAFFRLAEEQGIDLNKEERRVLDIALNQGVLLKKDGVLSAGKGAILSTSQEIPAYLERRLLAHETIHGIFYAVPDFREGAFSIYEEMSPLEKEFWYSFLGNKGRLDNRSGYDGYDVENEYLLVNEIAGHMMQLQPHVVEPYFLDVYLPRLEELLPEKRDAFQSIRRDTPDMFARTRERLEALLEETIGVKRGNLFMAEKITE